MTDVFISYARNDRNEVRYIAHALTAEGFSVWWDPEIKPGKKLERRDPPARSIARPSCLRAGRPLPQDHNG